MTKRGAVPAKSNASSRRVPTQARSLQRVERILDAAANVFAEAGYDTATMEAIALRAETSIGSVYQFFPNKLAIFDAVAARYLEHSSLLFDALMNEEALARPWEELVDAFIDAFFAFHRAEIGFRAVWSSMKLSPEFIAKGDALNVAFARRIEAVLKTQARSLTKGKRVLVARMIVEIVSAMLIFSSRTEDPFGARVMGETKVLVRRYLEPYAV